MKVSTDTCTDVAYVSSVTELASCMHQYTHVCGGTVNNFLLITKPRVHKAASVVSMQAATLNPAACSKEVRVRRH